jgi:hypothetical protein
MNKLTGRRQDVSRKQSGSGWDCHGHAGFFSVADAPRKALEWQRDYNAKTGRTARLGPGGEILNLETVWFFARALHPSVGL